jgi:hypothetical protein
MPAEERRKVLRISSEGGVRLFEIGELIRAKENAYNGTLVSSKRLMLCIDGDVGSGLP